MVGLLVLSWAGLLAGHDDPSDSWYPVILPITGGCIHYWISAPLLTQVHSSYGSLPAVCIMKAEIGVPVFGGNGLREVEPVTQKSQESCEWPGQTQSCIQPPISSAVSLPPLR